MSENFYWRGVEEGNFRGAARPAEGDARGEDDASSAAGSRWLLTTELPNAVRHAGADGAPEGRARARSGDRILPALYSDNYVSLMPGERRTIRSEVEVADARGETPRVTLDGYNVVPRH